MSKSLAKKMGLGGAAVAAFLSFGAYAHAATVTYSFNGIIDGSSAGVLANFSATPVGTAFNILLTFDPATPDTNPLATQGIYSDNLTGNFALTIAGGPSLTIPTAFIVVTPSVDWVASANLIDGTNMLVELTGISPDDQIIPSLLLTGGVFLFTDCNIFCNNTRSYAANGHVTSFERVSDVPLPAALPLFAAGLGSVGFYGWRKKRQPRLHS